MNDMSIAPVIAAIVAAFLTHRWTLKREDLGDRRLVAREAASSLCRALYRIRRLVERSDVQPVRSQEIFEAVAGWEAVWRKHESLLPGSWRHVRRSVASALGEHFGAIGASNLFSVPEVFPVATHDPIWWDRACDYLQYVGHQLSRWGNRPVDARKIKIYNFDAWLSQRR